MAPARITDKSEWETITITLTRPPHHQYYGAVKPVDLEHWQTFWLKFPFREARGTAPFCG